MFIARQKRDSAALSSYLLAYGFRVGVCNCVLVCLWVCVCIPSALRITLVSTQTALVQHKLVELVPPVIVCLQGK